MKRCILILLPLISAACTQSQQEIEGEKQVTNEAVTKAVTDLATFRTDGMRTDSTHWYGAGDCFGTLYMMSDDMRKMEVDSMTCGEYGFTFTHYLENPAGELMAFRRLKWESVISPDANRYIYLLQEEIYNLGVDPGQYYFRKDTLETHYVITNSVPAAVKKPFSKGTAINADSVRVQIKMQLQDVRNRPLNTN